MRSVDLLKAHEFELQIPGAQSPDWSLPLDLAVLLRVLSTEAADLAVRARERCENEQWPRDGPAVLQTPCHYAKRQTLPKPP